MYQRKRQKTALFIIITITIIINHSNNYSNNDYSNSNY